MDFRSIPYLRLDFFSVYRESWDDVHQVHQVAVQLLVGVSPVALNQQRNETLPQLRMLALLRPLRRNPEVSWEV